MGMILKLLLILSAVSASARTEKTKPVVLQWTASHFRNIDQVSLIFKKDHVELVTNTSSWQKDGAVKLGQFESSYTKDLKKLSRQIETYHAKRLNTVPALNFIKIKNLKVKTDPHAAVLTVNGKKIPNGQPDFKALSKIFYTIWEHKWRCIHCAVYTQVKSSIVRTLTISIKNINTPPKLKKTFSKKDFNCIEKQKAMECIDPGFGIFKL